MICDVSRGCSGGSSYCCIFGSRERLESWAEEVYAYYLNTLKYRPIKIDKQITTMNHDIMFVAPQRHVSSRFSEGSRHDHNAYIASRDNLKGRHVAVMSLEYIVNAN